MTVRPIDIAILLAYFAATINAAPAYLVNDIYKRFINPDSSGRSDIWLSRVASLAVLVVGIAFGLITDSITEVMMWVVGAPYSGYVMANVFKWIWWRFNGYGYFWGMMAGILGAMAVPQMIPVLAPRIFSPAVADVVMSNAIYSFPVLLVLSLFGCLVGTAFSPPENAEILKHFYRTTRPWGFWGPIRDAVMREDPAFQPNRDFRKDMLNVMTGIVWQLCLTSLPIFIVLREWSWAGGTLFALVFTTLFIKINWYEQLPAADTP